MIQNTEQAYRVIPVIRRRWSPKSFSSQEVELPKLRSAFEAARWAASSYNEQPWRFIVGIKDKGSTYDLLFDSLQDKNKMWAQSAPVLVLVCCKSSFTYKEQPNRCALYDTGAAVCQMVLQLYNDGIHTRQIAGLDTETARRHFNVPVDYNIICAMAIGILEGGDEEDDGPPRARKDFDEFVFSENWNLKSGLF
jgi:hypothetical protein